MAKDIEMFEWAGLSEEVFVEIPLSEEIRSDLPSFRMHSDGTQADYNDTYEDIYVLFQDMGNDYYLVYIRDYNFGSLKPLAEGFYEYDRSRCDIDCNFAVYAAADIFLRVLRGEIDLDHELYDYYHVLPMGMKIDRFFPGETIGVAAAASKLGCTASRVKRMVEDRKLEGFKTEGEIKITVESVEGRLRYIEQHGIPTKSTTFRMMNACSVMTPEKTDECYEQAMRVHSGEIGITDAVKRIVSKEGMKESSARMYVNAALAIANGSDFDSDINTFSVNRYLDRVFEDFGEKAMPKAWATVMRRFEYTKNQKNTCWYYKKAVDRSKKLHK